MPAARSCLDCSGPVSGRSTVRCRQCRNASQIDPERDERMARAYCTGLTLIEVGERFGVAKSTVCKAMERVGCKRRSSGTRSGRPSPFTIRRPKAPAQTQALAFRPPRARSWCQQCDRGVYPTEAARCASAFCKVKPIAHGVVDKSNATSDGRSAAGA